MRVFSCETRPSDLPPARLRTTSCGIVKIAALAAATFAAITAQFYQLPPDSIGEHLHAMSPYAVAMQRHGDQGNAAFAVADADHLSSFIESVDPTLTPTPPSVLKRENMCALRDVITYVDTECDEHRLRTSAERGDLRGLADSIERASEAIAMDSPPASFEKDAMQAMRSFQRKYVQLKHGICGATHEPFRKAVQLSKTYITYLRDGTYASADQLFRTISAIYGSVIPSASPETPNLRGTDDMCAHLDPDATDEFGKDRLHALREELRNELAGAEYTFVGIPVLTEDAGNRIKDVTDRLIAKRQHDLDVYYECNGA